MALQCVIVFFIIAGHADIITVLLIYSNSNNYHISIIFKRM